MKTIPLTQGKFALVDDEDFDFLNQWKWYFNNGYARRKQNKKVVFMHRVVINTPEGMDTDHIDGNRLNNKKDNLRICTTSENMKNQRRVPSRKENRKYKGVFFNKQPEKYRSYIYAPTYKHLGYFATEKEAAAAYNKAAIIHFGEFACLNNISP